MGFRVSSLAWLWTNSVTLDKLFHLSEPVSLPAKTESDINGCKIYVYPYTRSRQTLRKKQLASPMSA